MPTIESMLKAGAQRVYLAGPMSGYPLFNFPAFDSWRDDLRAHGLDVVSPADIDRELGFDPTSLPDDWDWHKLPPEMNKQDIIRRDIEAILTCDTIVTLPGWLYSVGGQAELAVAQWCGLRWFNFDKSSPTPPPRESICIEADRLVSGERNADYGHPAEDFARTAQIWTALLGVDITPQQVGLCMIGVKLSRYTHRPKRDNLVDIAGYAKTVDMVEARHAEH